MADEIVLPALPDVSSLGPEIPQGLRTFLASVAFYLNVREGKLKASRKEDKFVTFRDLSGEDAGRVISSNKSVSIASTSSATGVFIMPPSAGEGDTVDLSIPPGLANVVIEASMIGIMATFDQPDYNKSGSSLSNHAYTMLYMADAKADGSSPGFAASKPTGQSAGPVIYVPIGSNRHVYCWLMNVSKADVKGPLSGGAAGYPASTPISPKVYIDLLNGAVFDGLTIKQNGFRVSSPDGTKQVTPFAVLTQDTVMGGITVPAGVYMDGAHIVNLEASVARLGSAVIDEAKIGMLAVSKLKVDTMTAAFASAVTGQFQDLSAIRARTGSLTVDKWLTISGDTSAYDWSGMTTPGYSFSGSASNGMIGMLFGRHPMSGFMFQVGDDTAKIWMSHWGDCGIKFPNFTVDKSGNAWFGGTLKANIVTTDSLQKEAATSLKSAEAHSGTVVEGSRCVCWLTLGGTESTNVLILYSVFGGSYVVAVNGGPIASKDGVCEVTSSMTYGQITGAKHVAITGQGTRVLSLAPGTHKFEIWADAANKLIPSAANSSNLVPLSGSGVFMSNYGVTTGSSLAVLAAKR